MAYINQEMKKQIVKKVKDVLPKDWKVSFSVKHYSTLIMTIKQMPKNDFIALGYAIDQKKRMKEHLNAVYDEDRASIIFENYIFEDYQNDTFEGEFYIPAGISGSFSKKLFSRAFDENKVSKLLEIADALACQNYNRSDAMTDYFDVGYYMSLNFGSYDKPCKLI